jgi:DNA-binding Lrp family transcriptional regulator
LYGVAVKLTEKELDIVACMAFDASMSVAEVSGRTGLREHVVRHALHKLIDHGTVRLRPFVNPFALGLMEFYAEVSLETPGQQAVGALTEALVAAPMSTFVTEVAGDAHLCVMFLSKTLADVPTFFDEICATAAQIKFRKTVSHVIEVIVAHPNRDAKAPQNNIVSYSANVKPQKYDELDGKILILLGSGKIVSRRDLGLQCGVAQSTIDYRLQTLRQRGILLALGYVVPPYRDGLFRYTLRVNASRPCGELNKLLREVARTHSAVRAVTHLAGSWDYLVDVGLSQPGLVTAFSHELHRYLEPFVSKIEALPELHTHKMYVNPHEMGIFRKLQTR